MAKCRECRRSFRVMEDEDDGQHGCPYCGYGDRGPEEAEVRLTGGHDCPKCGDNGCHECEGD